MKFKTFYKQSELTNFVNSNPNVNVVSITSSASQGVDLFTLFYNELEQISAMEWRDNNTDPYEEHGLYHEI